MLIRVVAPIQLHLRKILANALNEVGGACKTQFAGAGSQFDPLALEIVKSFSNSYNLKGCMEKMPQGGVAVSDDYAKYGVKSRDLISKDGKIRISVKKSTSQIISAQGGETAAVFMAVLKNIQYKNIDLGEKMSQLIKKYFSHEQGISDLKSLSPNERKKAKVKRNFLLQRIKNFGGSTLNYYLVREALLGEYKFSGGADDPAVPNYFLVWDDNGTGKFYEAEKFVKSVASRIKFGVRGRGGTRGLAFRGDKSK